MKIIKNQMLIIVVLVAMLGIPEVASASKFAAPCEGLLGCLLLFGATGVLAVVLPLLPMLFVAYLIYKIYKNRNGSTRCRHILQERQVPSPVQMAAPVSERRAPQDPGTVLGVISCVCGIVGLLHRFGILLSVLGLITGIIGRRQAKAASNATGAEIGLIGIIVSALAWLWGWL